MTRKLSSEVSCEVAFQSSIPRRVGVELYNKEDRSNMIRARKVTGGTSLIAHKCLRATIFNCIPNKRGTSPSFTLLHYKLKHDYENMLTKFMDGP